MPSLPGFTVERLLLSEVEQLVWGGGPDYRDHVRQALERVADGQVEYLAVKDPGGQILAVGGIDFSLREDAGRIWQLVTHPERRSQGLGSMLIEALEERARQRGLPWVRMGVEDVNSRALALYQRLGYQDTGEVTYEQWQTRDAQGNKIPYHATIHELIKPL